MAEYANEHLNIFIQEKDLKESVLKTIPVPSNLQEVRQLDGFMAQPLKEKRQKILLQQDAIYEKVQRKNMDVMGPLCKLWESLVTANKEQDSSVSINDLIKFVTQSIILVGQTNIALSYHRRLSALDGVMKSTIQAKSMLKNKSELLQKENKDLFGKEFREQVSSGSGNQPFWKDPQPSKQHRGGGGGGQVLTNTIASKRAET